MILFSIVGGIDKIFGNKLGLGEKFDEGFKAMGGLALTVIGVYSLSPIIGKVLIPILNPLAKVIKADPSVFISSLLAIDMGGYAASRHIGEFNGFILASMMGATISFTIPVAVNLISKDDFAYFAKGILAGIITIPLGMLVGGIMMKISLRDILLNLIPVIIFSTLIVIGLIKAQEKIIGIFNLLGKGIIIISTIGLLISILDFTLGIKLIDNIISFEEGVILVANIAIVLSGAYPLFHFISKKLNRTLSKVTKMLGIDEHSLLGLITSLANCIPMLGIYDKMNWKGKVINAAFAVSGSFTFGGQLGYISSISPSAVNPFIISKLIAGLAAILVAILLIKFEQKPKRGVKYEY
jgi:ethanolamine transporter